MKKFKVKFIHTDKSIREIDIEATDQETAILRFRVNWDWEKEMEIISVYLPT